MTTVLGFIIGHVELNKALQSHVTFHDVTWDMVNASEPVTWHVSWQESSKRAFSWLLGRCHVGSMS